MKKGLVGFGELLLRLDTPGHSRFSQLENFQAKFTGGEANVLVAAKRFGVESCSVVSSVPNHALGDACLEFLNRYGVETRRVVRGGERLGILYVETGASLRPTRVIYDRDHTSFRETEPTFYDWEKILHQAEILHITGTAPALGPNVNQAIDDGIKVAKANGCKISFDCSYRSALWSIESASSAYRRLAESVDILFASPQDADLFFGIDEKDGEKRMQHLLNDYGLELIAYTDRVEKTVSRNELTGTVFSPKGYSRTQSYDIEVVDRIGSGDAFAGGFLASLMEGKNEQESLEFATAAAALKHTIPGDFCLVEKSEVLELLNGASLRIRR